MAEPNKELDNLAFEIFSKQPLKGAAERDARDSYRRAEAFLAVQQQAQSGKLKPKEATTATELVDICCPNLPATSPFNLVAKVHTDRKGTQTRGDLAKVNQIANWLYKNPTPDDDAQELVDRLNHQFPKL